MDHYDIDELWEQMDDFYLFHEEFSQRLCSSLTYLSRNDADAVLSKCLFFPFAVGSWHLPPSLIRGRSVAIIDERDLENRDEAIVTILHEAAHAYLGHSEASGYSRAEMQRTEDEAWSQVRTWLPDEFTSVIDDAERHGGGSKAR